MLNLAGLTVVIRFPKLLMDDQNRTMLISAELRLQCIYPRTISAKL
jgi:hypothetical protein